MDLFRDREFSTAMFLGKGELLKDLIEKDTQTLKENGVTFSELANGISGVIEFFRVQPWVKNGHEVKATYLEWSPQNSCFRTTFTQHFGYQYCPFQECCEDPATFNNQRVGDTIANIKKIVDNVTVGEIQLGSLLSHLAETHHFLEGETCEFRINPQQFIDLFDLKKEKSIVGTITPNWLQEKVQREGLEVAHVLDPIPNILKFCLGSSGLVFC